MDIYIENKDFDNISIIYRYEYPYKKENKYKAINDIYEDLYIKLIASYTHYCFKDRIKFLKEHFNNSSGIKKEEKKLYEQKIKNFENEVKLTRKNITNDYWSTLKIMFKSDENFEKFEDNVEACNIFDKIMIDKLNEASKKCIHHEKKLIAFNDYLIDLFNHII